MFLYKNIIITDVPLLSVLSWDRIWYKVPQGIDQLMDRVET